MYKILTKKWKFERNNVKLYENRRLKGADSLFCQREMGQGVLSKSFYSQ
jgi:hypothetical protein